ncbi:pilus assembly protein TadG-related protein [Sphingomonas sp. LT1P40]|uniref:pilus assembly protein TadG-related protein n=1 Tax=Alteristakelama amylovorans TaxID=3096166 RepID=UPI002FCCB361
MTRRLSTDRRGATAVMVASALPFLLAATAAAVDVGAVALERRRMQGAVDAAALSAAQDLASATVRANAILSANRAEGAATTQVATGSVSGSGSARAFTAGGANDAVRVTATYPNQAYFLRALGLRFNDATVSAVASRRNLGAISIGSGLASFDNGLVNTLTRGLTGSSVGFSLLSYQGLATVDLNLFTFLDAVAVRANLGVMTYDQLLEQQIALPVLLRALDDTSGGHGLGAVAAGINGTPRSLRLGDLIGLDMAGAGNTGSGGASALLARVRASDLLGAMLSVANRDHIVALDLAGSIPGLASVRAEIKIGETIQSSPWMVVNDRGGVEVSTAQARVNLVAEVGPLLGLAVKLPLAAEVAPARAILDAVPCAPRDTAAVRARAGVARLAIADLAVGDPIPASAAALTPAPLIRAPLISVDAKAFGALEASNWQNLSFTRAEIVAHQMKAIATTDGVTNLLGTTLQSTQIDVNILGLGLGIGLPGQGQIATRLLQVAPALETALFQLLAFAGLSIGTAHVRVDGYRCGKPVLVL